MRIAIIGSGIAGLSAAYALSQHHDITLFEEQSRLGGHSHTLEMPDGFGGQVPVDTGFIVYNSHNYPNLIRLFDEVGVATEDSDMSFAVSIGHGAMEYFGDPKGMFAQKRNLLRPSHWLMVRDILRFYKQAPSQMALARQQNMSLGDLLDHGNYSTAFRYRHIYPMAAAIWSTPVAQVSDFPAETFIGFFENHRLFDLDLVGRPAWRTVSGGSREYVHKISACFADCIATEAPVLAVRRNTAGISLQTGGAHAQEIGFDQIIFACHPDQALKILGAQASAQERAILGAIQFSKNLAVLHQDPALMPKRKQAWASWNYLADHEGCSDGTLSPVALTYWMNRLQNLKTREPVLVTLNPGTMPASETTHAILHYDHPLFSRSALVAQRNLGTIQGQNRAWFCGAWCGYGFHEDGASAGFAVARALGAPTSWAQDIIEMSPASDHASPRQASA